MSRAGVTSGQPRRQLVRRGVQLVVSLGLVAVLLVVVMPRVTGAQWAEVVHELARPGWLELAGLLAVWLLGLWVFAYVLAACLPGMRPGQAFSMNFVSSAVANLVPFGGMAGVGISWWMVRSWGFTLRAFSLFTVVTFIVNWTTKAVVPGVALAALVLTGRDLPPPVVEAAATGAALCAVTVAVLVAFLGSDRVARGVAAVVEWLGHGVQRLFRLHREVDWGGQVMHLRERTGSLLRERWRTITVAMVGYQALQAVLMWLCLRVVGGPTDWAVVLCAFASGRLLTSVVLTPGGTGFVETGTAAVLVALGGDPAASVAGTFLFSVFTFVLEIPGGAIAWLVFVARRRRTGASPPDVSAGDAPAPSRRAAPGP